MKGKVIFGEFARYAFFNVAGMLGISCYVIADTFFIALGAGKEGLAALNFAFPPWYLMNGMTMMLGVGGAARYSISNSPGVFAQTFYPAVILGAAFSFAGLFLSSDLAAFMGASGECLAMTSVYLKILFAAAPLFFLQTILVFFVRNDGNPGLSMAAMISGSFANIFLDWLFIVVFGWGIAGAAFATIISPVTSIFILRSHVARRRGVFRFFNGRMDLRRTMDVFSLGFYSLLNDAASGICVLAFNLIVLKMAGNTGVAAYGIIANTAIVVTSVFNGIAQGLQPLASDRFGRGEIGEVRLLLRYAAGLVVIVFAAVQLSVLFFAGPLVAVYNSSGDPSLALIAENGMRLYFLSLAFSGLNVLASVFLGGVDRGGPAFAVSFVKGIVVILPSLFILGRFFGLNGVWLAPSVSELLTLGLSAFFVRRFFADPGR